jgi:hypothetical protein
VGGGGGGGGGGGEGEGEGEEGTANLPVVEMRKDDESENRSGVGGCGGGGREVVAKEGARTAYELRDEQPGYTNRLRATSMRHGCQLAG